MLKFYLLPVVVFFFLMCGCAFLPSYRVEKEGRAFITDYPLNRIAVEKAVSEHRLMYGMTMEEVVKSCGNPDLEHELIINGKVYYSWLYRKNNLTRILYFNRGILVDIQ